MKKSLCESNKTAIIGGGITGLYLAWKLSEKGEKVTVFEKKTELGKKECSGLVSERLFEFIPQSKSLVENKIDFVLIHTPRKTFKVRFKKSFFVLSHAKLDKIVAELAQKAGAEIALGREIRSLPKNFDRIIGCDGYNSFARKSLNLKDPFFRLAMQGFLKDKHSSGCVETWGIKNGFIWKIPRAGEIEYGIVANPGEAKNLFSNFCKINRLNLSGIRSSIIPLGLTLAGDSRIALCGDAAGLTKPWSGGGIIWGLESADILLQSFPDFAGYCSIMRKKFSGRIFFSKALTGFGYFMAFNFPWLLPGEVKIDGDSLA